MYALGVFLALLSVISIARAHTVITYPGWRGNNLHTNGTLPSENPESLGIDFSDNGTVAFPWGQQWIYPCRRSIHECLRKRNDRLTLHLQAAACHNRLTAPSGQSTVVDFPSSQAGSPVTALRCSTSISASLKKAVLRLPICHTRLFRRSSSWVRTISNTLVSSVCHKSACPKTSTYKLARTSQSR